MATRGWTRKEQKAMRAGAQWVRDNAGDLPDDLQSYAMDLAVGCGLDPDMVHEGMIREREKLQ